MPRLVCLADYGGTYGGSFIPMLVAIGRAVRAEGWSVELVFSELARHQTWLATLSAEQIPYRFLDIARSRSVRRGAWIAEELLRDRWGSPVTRAVSEVIAEATTPTIVHTHFSAFDVAAAHAARAHPNAAVIWHEHSMRPAGAKVDLGGLVRYRVFGRAVDRVLCVGAGVMHSTRRLAGHDRVQLVSNGIDTDRFSGVTTAERASARAELGIAADAAVLLHFGSYWHIKGGDCYLAAVKLLAARRPNCQIHALTVGRDEARSAVNAADLSSIVEVLDPREDVRILYAAADVLVSPSRTEGAPLTVLEALATGIPVVASDIPGHAFLADIPPACTLTDLDPDRIAASIGDVLDQDAVARAHAARLARRWVVEHRGLSTWTEVVMAIYEDVLREQVRYGPRGRDSTVHSAQD